MDEIINFLSDDGYVRAFANIFGIVAGLLILFKGITWSYRFAIDTFASNLRTAIFKLNFRFARMYISSARDLFIMITRVVLLQSAITISVAGLIIVKISSESASDEKLKAMFEDQYIFSDFDSYLFFQDIVSGLGSAGMMAGLMVSTLFVALFADNVRSIRVRWRQRGRLEKRPDH